MESFETSEPVVRLAQSHLQFFFELAILRLQFFDATYW